MTTRNLIIFCDESIAKGKSFSNFYGGALVDEKDVTEINKIIDGKKKELNLNREVKWGKITSNYSQKYIDLIGTVFELISAGKIKIRIMFTQNRNVPAFLTKTQKENSYFLLYYQFVKHSFGLTYSNPDNIETNVRIYADRLPDRKEKINIFKFYLASLSNDPRFKNANISIKKENITEIDSKKHSILQCLDIILGSIQFRLNGNHLAKPIDSKQRSKRTIAKEKVYKEINNKIREIYPNFNIGISTGIHGDLANRWKHPYRHWLFVPREFVR